MYQLGKLPRGGKGRGGVPRNKKGKDGADKKEEGGDAMIEGRAFSHLEGEKGRNRLWEVRKEGAG